MAPAPRALSGSASPSCSRRSRRQWSRHSRSPESLAFSAQALHKLLVAGLGPIVGRPVLLGVLGHDQRCLEIALPGPRALDHRAASLGEEIGRRALVSDGDARLAVREREGAIEALGLPLDRARLA